MNPDHNYINRFSERFRGYLSCCSLDHVFRACPHKTSPEIKHRFFEDLWAHVSSTKKFITNSRASKEQTLLRPQPLTSMFCLLTLIHIPLTLIFRLLTSTQVNLLQRYLVFTLLFLLIISLCRPKNQYQFQ